jgi:integrase
MAELQDLADRAGAYRLMILVLGLSGLRFGECAALRVRSVDLMRRRLRVSESVSEVNGHMTWSTPKTHQSREVPIPRSLIDALIAQAAAAGSLAGSFRASSASRKAFARLIGILPRCHCDSYPLWDGKPPTDPARTATRVRR